MVDLLNRAQVSDQPERVRRRPAPGYATVPVLIAAHALVLLDVQVAVLRPAVALFAVLVLPALVLHRRVEWRVEDTTTRVLYAAGATVLGVVLTGLALNTLLPVLGVARPLDRVPVTITSLVVDLALVLWRPRTRLGPEEGWLRALRRISRSRFELAQSLAAGSLALGVVGAVRLNNEAGGGVALVAHALAVLAVLVLLVRSAGTRGRDVWTVGMVGAGLLLATSLRGWFITGHDIQREYIAFLLTNGAGRWEMAAFPSPYNACLSVNILPTVLAQTTGLSGIVVFKLVMQLAMVLVPVATYLLARRLVPRRQAVVSALAVIMFPTFHNDMPYLVRQEVAFFFLSLVLLAATESAWGTRRRRVAVVTFGAAVVLSHYSTTYVLLIALVIGTAGWVATGRWERRRGRSRAAPSGPRPVSALLSLWVVVPLAAAAVVWTGPVTHTGGHFEETAQQTIDLVLNGGGGPGSSDLAYGLFAGRQATPRERLDMYVDQTLDERRAESNAGRLVTAPGQDLLRPRIIEPGDLPLTAAGRGLESVGIDATTFSSVLRLGSAGLLQVLLVVGFVAVVLRSRFARSFGTEARWLVTGALGALGAVVVLPGLSVEYGVLRAFEQTLLVVAPVLAVGAQVLTSRLGRYAGAALVVVWGGLFAVLNGLVPTMFGGYPAQLALANSGLYYDLYYVNTQEVSAAGWLQSAQARPGDGAPVQSEVISDKVAATRLQSSLGASATVAGDFFPTELRQGSFVVLGPETIAKQQATVFYTGNLISYRYPVSLLSSRLDVVYSSPLARIYR